MSLMDEFLSEELNPLLAKKILSAVSDGPDFSEFFGNRFDVTIDKERQIIRIDDDLDCSEAGHLEVKVSEVIEVLTNAASAAE